MEIYFKGHLLDVEADITIYNDGDYWTPNTPSVIEINEVNYNGNNITDLFLDLLNVKDLAELEEQIIEHYENI